MTIKNYLRFSTLLFGIVLSLSNKVSAQAPLCSFPAAHGCEFQIKVAKNTNSYRAYGGRLPSCNTRYPLENLTRLTNNCRADVAANLTQGINIIQLIQNEIATNPSQGSCGTLNYEVETNIFVDNPPAYGSFATTSFDRMYITYGYGSDAYLSSGSINLAACPQPSPIIKVLIQPSRTPFIANEWIPSGRSGQNYTIDIEISNGPTTAPITFNMQLPAGVTVKVADPISAVGGTIACTGSALSTCSIATGAPIGHIFVNVFVEVANSTTNAQASVIAIGGGDAKCNGIAPACTSSTAVIPILDAVSESVNKTHLAASTTDVSTNDKLPPGSAYSLSTGSTCVNASISPAGIASYTSPAAIVSVNAACTVVYKLCAPAPSRLVCKEATLTVSTQRAINNNSGNVAISNNEEKDPVPAVFSVTKTSSSNPLFIGKPGQFYTINIAVQNGFASGPILLLDKLPAGITTSGPITAAGGIISGCPATGATDLAGCSVAVRGNATSIIVTVPISVAIAALNGANTAMVKGGGSVLCTGIAPACSGSTGPIAIVDPVDAVDDAVTQPANTVHSFNVATNDKYPAGSVFSAIAAGSTCLGASVSAAGIANYALPVFNSSAPTCVVQYQVCAPSTSQAGCDSAFLRVTMFEVNAEPDTLTVYAPSVAGSTAIAGNDKYPAGSIFSLDGTGSTCAGAQVSAAGVAGFTSPANGTSCTVKYKLCAPAPYQTVCDISSLTVNTSIVQGCSSLSLSYQATVPASSSVNTFNKTSGGCSFFALGSNSLPISLPAGSYKLVGAVVPFGSTVPVSMTSVTFTLTSNGFLKGKAEYDTALSKWKLVQLP